MAKCSPFNPKLTKNWPKCRHPTSKAGSPENTKLIAHEWAECLTLKWFLLPHHSMGSTKTCVGGFSLNITRTLPFGLQKTVRHPSRPPQKVPCKVPPIDKVPCLQLDYQSARHTQKNNFPANQKGYDNFETTDEKLLVRRIQIFQVPFSVIICLPLIFKISENMVPTKRNPADLDSPRQIL